MSLLVSFRALSFPLLANALTVPQHVAELGCHGCSLPITRPVCGCRQIACGSVSHTSDRRDSPVGKQNKAKWHNCLRFDYDCLRTCSCHVQRIQKQTGVCFFLGGLQLRHDHPFICCQIEAGLFAGYIQCQPCRIPLYRCSFHSTTKNLTRPVLLKERHRYFLHCCMQCAPARHL